MAENQIDSSELTPDSDDGKTPPISADELTDISLEDTGESPVVQQQEMATPENNDAPQAEAAVKSAAVRGSPEAVLAELAKFMGESGDNMTWKEHLRLLSIEHQVGRSYFGLWTEEANLFFRRLVILKKRMESVKHKQRA